VVSPKVTEITPDHYHSMFF